jgi:hypothetical protein
MAAEAGMGLEGAVRATPAPAPARVTPEPVALETPGRAAPAILELEPAELEPADLETPALDPVALEVQETARGRAVRETAPPRQPQRLVRVLRALAASVRAARMRPDWAAFRAESAEWMRVHSEAPPACHRTRAVRPTPQRLWQVRAIPEHSAERLELLMRKAIREPRARPATPDLGLEDCRAA